MIELAADEGIALEIVQAYRSPATQQTLFDSGAGVTKAPALFSYHNYGLAFDVVPTSYKASPDWNPTGSLWNRIGALGESLGLTWGGRWKAVDLPHFQLTAAPISELKAYWEKFRKIMPVDITPTAGGAVIALALILGYIVWLRPLMSRRGL